MKAKSKAQPKASARGRQSLRLLRLRIFPVRHSPGPGGRPCRSTARRLSRSCGVVQRLLAWLCCVVCLFCLFIFTLRAFRRASLLHLTLPFILDRPFDGMLVLRVLSFCLLSAFVFVYSVCLFVSACVCVFVSAFVSSSLFVASRLPKLAVLGTPSC